MTELNKKELDLIILIQDYKRFINSKNMFFNENLDWYEIVRDYFENDITTHDLKQTRFSHNNKSLEYILSFKVTDEHLNKEI
ncbi:hypothetical protein P3U41_05720 [Mammaliicoccus sciuri]|uniref:hypothetical protein n=1 Tax=Mammaliicoccus sciuri TaxID=1296 RepID=UPI002B25D2A1|nr:hypothetical protein [Mammaliicoccus sciuri]WQL34267.1 hypothetical protein P3U41_05720 [Mammaliicoccus sciuri]WQL61206.1 hypothetical protein P3T96_05720 [Mammaliicoccus sciuri]